MTNTAKEGPPATVGKNGSHTKEGAAVRNNSHRSCSPTEQSSKYSKGSIRWQKDHTSSDRIYRLQASCAQKSGGSCISNAAKDSTEKRMLHVRRAIASQQSPPKLSMVSDSHYFTASFESEVETRIRSESICTPNVDGEGVGEVPPEKVKKQPDCTSSHYRLLKKWEQDLCMGLRAKHGPVLFAMEKMPEKLYGEGNHSSTVYLLYIYRLHVRDLI